MEKDNKKKSKKSYVLLAIVLVIVVIAAGIKLYIDDEHVPLHTIEEYQELTTFPISETDNRITVRDQETIDEFYNVGIIFYTGEHINGQCYLPLMANLANFGYDTFLPKALGSLPILNLDGADQIVNKFKWVTDWYLVAHSDACEMAARYAKGHKKIKGLILLGGSVKTDISDTGIKVLSIVGTNDSILDLDRYEKAKTNLPKDTIYKEIKGGNHTAFADTALLKGDTKTSFKASKQIEKTADIIKDFIK